MVINNGISACERSGGIKVENNALSKGSPLKYANSYKNCKGNLECEHDIRRTMAKESSENIQKIKTYWDIGDDNCVREMGEKLELSDTAYTILRQQDDMAGRAYEASAKYYADIIANCAGKCSWLEAALAKTGADGLTNLVYGALGATGSTSIKQAGISNKVKRDLNGTGKHTEVEFADKSTRRSANQLVVKNLSPSEAIKNLSHSGYIKTISKDGSVTVLTKGDTVYRFYPRSTGGGISGSDSGVPSASVSVKGKVVTKLRFP